MAKRKIGYRYPNGRLKEKPKPWEPFHQEFISINRTHDGRRWVTSMKDDGSTALDRLLHRKLISGLEHAAGEEFAAVWLWYRKLYLGAAAGFGKVAQMERGLGFGEDGRQDVRAAKAYDGVWRALVLRKGGYKLLRIASNVCLFDQDPIEAHMFALKRGLRVLVRHFGLN